MPETEQPQAIVETLERRLIYRSPWVNLYCDRVRFPNGRIIEQHHLLDFDHQAVMAVIRGADTAYLMVKVCRYPTGRAEWEFPAGSLEAGENALAAAAREVLEESGYTCTDLEPVITYHPMNGIANQVFHIVRGQAGGEPGEFDTGEISSVRWFSAAEIWEMIRSGEMMDGYTLTAFLLEERGG